MISTNMALCILIAVSLFHWVFYRWAVLSERYLNTKSGYIKGMNDAVDLLEKKEIQDFDDWYKENK